MRLTPLALGLLLTLLPACTGGSKEAAQPKKDDPKKAALEKMLLKLEKEYLAYDEKIKNSGTDMGLNNQLIEEKELLRSRLERVKENLKKYGVTTSSTAAAEGGEAHH